MGRSHAAAEELVPVTVRTLAVDPVSNMPVVILESTESAAYLPIWIGLFEANSIALQLEGVAMPRPMTHDLLKSLVESLGYAIEAVVIHSLEENVFFAKLLVRCPDGSTVEVDSRPSDALAVALRCGASIMVARAVLDAAQLTGLPDNEESIRAILERLRPEDMGRWEM